jgi:hypothetical protein
MIKGACIIDGIDIADFGMYITKGGDYDFISFPERKEPLLNNWYEHNGVDADLSEIFFKEKQVKVSFYITADTGTQFVARWARFRSLITAPGYRQVYIREFDRTFRLRYLSCPEFEHHGGMHKTGQKWSLFSITFSQDDPLMLFTDSTITDPIQEYSNRSYVSIGDRDLADYGIIVTECYNTMLAAPAIKEPLRRSFERANGLDVATPSVPNFETKQVVVSCTMRAGSLSVFWRNYVALFNAITKKEEILLSSFAGEERCFYSRMRNFEKRRPFASRILCSFELVFTCIDTGEVNFLLASEDDRLIITEDDIYFIDMAYYG